MRKYDLEKQVINLKQLNIQLEKQIMSSKEQTECTGKTTNEGKLRELIKQDGGLRKLEIRKSAEGREGNVGIAYFETKDQAIKTTETFNKSKQYVAKQYKINDENGPREQKQQSKTLSNHRKEKINGKNTKRETIGLSYKQRQKKAVKVVQIMKKSVMHVIQVNI